MDSITTYTLIGDNDPEPASISFFMMNNLLYSRIDSGYPSNSDQFDEDVNVYLAYLLESMMSPEYHEAVKQFVVPYDLPLFESIRNEPDPRVKYMTYRMNADFLLMSIGIFNNARGKRPDSTSFMNLSINTYIGRGKAYYDLAQSYLRKTTLRKSTMTEILGKLSLNFEKYINVISMLRSEYFNIYDRISQGELYHLGKSIEQESLKARISKKYDEFLDAYSRFRDQRTDEAKSALVQMTLELKKLDQSFDFDPDLLSDSEIPDEIAADI
ncbi:MAG: hypothetical protein JW814_06305 [Candidatus Krumholzibacteriota bacterium]|nr:hypothetical protein [Candidatus Krumholzibacteriota bacterium]